MADSDNPVGPLADANVGEVIIYVRDLPAMKRFYSETLGSAWMLTGVALFH
ncbi:MAG: hypothetical protein IIC25_03270 [Chloroflexi bacterium]|nr:hypothetical protein [Chloroflexota bacterium]